MDEEEIDVWYEEQKDKLTESYRKKIGKSKNQEGIKRDYLRRMASLRKKYERLSKSCIEKNLKSHFSRHRVAMLKKKMLAPLEAVFRKIFPEKKNEKVK